jgi:hypothetical protein
MWTASGLGCNMDPQHQVTQQQFTGPIPPYQFQQTSYNMMPLLQTTYVTSPSTTHQAHQQCPQHTINRTPSTSNIKTTPKISQKQQQTTLGNK